MLSFLWHFFFIFSWYDDGGSNGMNIVAKDYFGIVERFSVFAATGYNAVLGIELYRMKF